MCEGVWVGVCGVCEGVWVGVRAWSVRVSGVGCVVCEGVLVGVRGVCRWECVEV